MATLAVGNFGIDFTLLDLIGLSQGQISSRSETGFTIQSTEQRVVISGVGFSFGADGAPTSGTVTSLSGAIEGNPVYSITNTSISAHTLMSLINSGANEFAKTAVLAENDLFVGSVHADRMSGYAGNDTAQGGAGDDALDGGEGDDQIFGDAGSDTVTDLFGSNYLRGGEGDDYVVGGADFDNAHGNIGNDTVSGGGGDDWSVGGQGNDRVFGDAGSDLVYGQLGDDTCDGGAGSDAVIGGQGNDILFGGLGDDTISGDRASDTLSGGGGADLFLVSSVSGTDRITDFNAAEGDRLRLEAGSVYTLARSGADTLVVVFGGPTVTLAGFDLSSFDPTSIFLG